MVTANARTQDERAGAASPPRRRGAVYVLVLMLAMILTLAGITTVSVSRASQRMARDGGDWGAARMLAFSAAEHAMTAIKADANWRTTYRGQTVERSLGRGSFTWQLVDEIDGNLADNATQVFVIVARGTARNATYTLRVNMAAGTPGLVYGLSSTTAISLSSGAYVDSYDSTLGSYGGTNAGSNAAVQTGTTAPSGVSLANNAEIRGSVKVGVGGDPNVVISRPAGVTGSKTALTEAADVPVLTEPTGLGASSGDLATRNNQTLTINSSRHVGALSLDNGSSLLISGDVVLLVEGPVTIEQNAKIQVLPGASLKLYFKSTLTVENNADGMVVDGQNLSRLQLLGLGTGAVTLKKADIQGVIVAPNSALTMTSNAEVFGAVMARSVTMASNARIHQDQRITNGTDLVNIGSSGPTQPRPTAWRQNVQ